MRVLCQIIVGLYRESCKENPSCRTTNCGFDETKLAKEKRDRCIQEVWLCENAIAINKLPLGIFEQEWRRTHLPSVKKYESSKDYDEAISNFLDKEVSSLLFLELIV